MSIWATGVKNRSSFDVVKANQSRQAASKEKSIASKDKYVRPQEVQLAGITRGKDCRFNGLFPAMYSMYASILRNDHPEKRASRVVTLGKETKTVCHLWKVGLIRTIAVKDKYWKVRAKAAEWLGKIDARGRAEVAKLLGDQDKRVRAAARKALPKFSYGYVQSANKVIYWQSWCKNIAENRALLQLLKTIAFKIVKEKKRQAVPLLTKLSKSASKDAKIVLQRAIAKAKRAR